MVLGISQLLFRKRTYGFGIWALGLGYYLFYTPYSGLTKALSNGLLSGAGRSVPGAVLLPASVIATVVCMLGFITVMKWWKYAGRREFMGISFPFPRRLTFLSGVCTATIIGTTTLAFSFKGISIVLVLVLLRGGVLIIAPVVDRMFRRRVRWFSWAAMLISLLAVTIVLTDVGNYKLSLPAIVDVAAYLTAYFFKFQFMTRLAKSDDTRGTLRYFVEEQMTASPLLLLALGVMAVIGAGDVMMGFRVGFTAFLLSREAGIALLIGLFYAGLCICTTFIFLDRRENTFCVPMHCGSSMLSGFSATYALTLFFNQPSPSAPQLVSAGFIIIALAVLSPLHHFELYLTKLRHSLSSVYHACVQFIAGRGQPRPVAASLARTVSPADMAVLNGCLAEEAQGTKIGRLVLFVCSGNTCRSPIAAAIGNAEIATRLRIPFEAVGQAHVQAISGGVSARVGAPMTPEAKQALRLLGIPPNGHRARNVTVELADQVERIFCMTQAHRDAVIDLVPAAAAKTLCLDPERDVEDPIGKGMAAYVDCAQRIQVLVRHRFDEIALQGGRPG
jgi:protein-tyrosine-phosphatase